MTFDHYDDFFRQGLDLKEPAGPFDYQRRLACGYAAAEFPELLDVPTGLGKTAAVVLAWLWRRRFHPDDAVRSATPRRLVYCLPMRVLVEQTRGAIVGWLHNLDELSGVLCSSKNGPGNYYPIWEGEKDRIPVFTLMGGEEAAEWEAFPEREAVIVGTQDMLLSRALNRGYAARPARWPMHFGLLNNDALWVMDEVQLMGVGRTSSVQLQHFSDLCAGQLPVSSLPRRTLWMSATLGVGQMSDTTGRCSVKIPSWMDTPELKASGIREVESHDCRTEADRKRLAPLVEARKSVIDKTGTNGWDVNSDMLLDAVLKEAPSGAPNGNLVLVMINQVARARQLYKRLVEKQRLLLKPDRPELLLLHSRFRPYDRYETLARLAISVPRAGRIVVSTQVLEAGVDLDGDALFTEVCPWPSLVQRLGRLNRKGGEGRVGTATFIGVPVEWAHGDGSKKKKLKKKEEEALSEAREVAARPYTWQELEESRKRIGQLPDNSASIASLEKLAPYPLERDGPLLRQFHLDDLFDTDPDLSGGYIDVSPFIRAMDREIDVYVFWRHLEEDVENEPPPHRDEICAVPIYELTRFGGQTSAWLLSLQRARKRKAAWREIRLTQESVRPGDTIMLDVEVGGYDDALGWLGVEGKENKPGTYVAQVDGRRVWARYGENKQIDVVDDLDTRVGGYSGREDDPRSFKRWMTLAQHLRACAVHARRLGESLTPDLSTQIETAALWHDVGKALERGQIGNDVVRPFQRMLRSAGVPENGHPKDEVLYAKSNKRGGTPARFRHEVASALAYLAAIDSPDDLVAYLVMAHHGKVRLMPEPWDDERMDDAAGVRGGDRIVAEAMKLAGQPAQAKALDPKLFLPAIDHPSWQGRVVSLLEEYGPYYLAYLEALVCIADWRASP